MANPFVHVELNTNDVAKAKGFYGKLFDWKMEDIPNNATGAYTMIRVGDGTGGGLMKNPMPGAPSFWLAYVLVDDIEASTKKAKSLGATVMKDVTEVMGMGWLSIIVDPTGAALGLWKTKQKRRRHLQSSQHRRPRGAQWPWSPRKREPSGVRRSREAFPTTLDPRFRGDDECEVFLERSEPSTLVVPAKAGTQWRSSTCAGHFNDAGSPPPIQALEGRHFAGMANAAVCLERDEGSYAAPGEFAGSLPHPAVSA
jgi:hypothetical protein